MLPTLQLHHTPISVDNAESRHAHFHALMRAAQDKNSNTLPSLAVNQRVLIQHHDTKLRTIKGVVRSICPVGISFVIQLRSGQNFIKGRQLLRPDRSGTSSHPSLPTPPSQPASLPSAPSSPTHQSQPPQPSSPITAKPRRQIKKPSRFLD